MAVTPFSERIRNAREQGDPPNSVGMVSYWTGRVDYHEATRIGAVLLQGHLTIGTPDTFYSPEIEASVVDVERFLSDKEKDQLLSADHDEDQMERLRHSDATVLAVGQPPQDEDGPIDWVVGILAYREPNERLIGPEHQSMSVSDFGSKFIERGGSFLVFDPDSAHVRLANQCALATKFANTPTDNS